MSRLFRRRGRADGDRGFTLSIPAMALEAGEVVGLTGPSGTGKSTLLSLMWMQRRANGLASGVLANSEAVRDDAVVREGIAKPIVIGREKVVRHRLEQLQSDLRIGEDVELTDPENDDRYREYWEFYHSVMSRRGVSVAAAKTTIRTNTTAIAACMVARGEADAMIAPLT